MVAGSLNTMAANAPFVAVPRFIILPFLKREPPSGPLPAPGLR
jgi:hypothetical protein